MFASNTSQVSGDAVFVEDVFQNWLYTGNGSTQTITNGIDLAGKGGLVWAKKRTSATDENHVLFDTARGQPWLSSNTTNAQLGTTGYINYNSNGFGWTFGSASWNNSGVPYASWTFRKQPKFFDVVTYTATGTNRTVPHNLGSVPGCIIVKCTSAGSTSWAVYHRSLGNTVGLILNGTDASITANFWGNTTPTATEFTVGDIGSVNYPSGQTYVAYLFAHNAGGFGLTGTDNVISCGITSGGKVTLGWEPQWILHKASNFSSNWDVIDTMRGMPWGNQAQMLNPNLRSAEALSNDTVNGQPYSPKLYADGFELGTIVGNHIYIAIRRGPMKTPTSGTSVFAPTISTNNLPAWETGFPVDMGIIGGRTGSDKMYNAARLLGESAQLKTNTTAAEAALLGTQRFDQMNGYGVASTWGTNYMGWMFRRAPGFFDEVCWTGDGTGNARSHNLTVYPELVISKLRSGGAGFGAWNVQNNISPSAKQTGFLNTTAAFSSSGATSPTATVFYPTDDQSGATYVAYLFASCPGVQSIQSYVGDGTTGRTINCGFAAGARFVCIKATSTTGSWWTFDSARGIVTNNDPALQLNSTAAEVTSADAIDTAASGFIVNQEATCSLNASGVTYLVWAVA